MFPLARHLALASVTGLALLCLCSPVWAADGAIQSIRYDPATRHFLINSSGSVRATVNTLTIAGHKRIIMDVENAEIGVNLPRDVTLKQQLMQDLPALRNLTINQYNGNGRPIVRILFDIDGDLQMVRLIQNQGQRLELEVQNLAMAGPSPFYDNPGANPSPDARIQPPSDSARPAYDESPGDHSQSPDTGIADSNGEVGTLRSALSVLNRKYDNTIRENESLKTQLASRLQDSSRADAARLQSALDAAEADNRALKVQLAARQESTVSADNLQTQLAQLRSENTSLQSRLRQLNETNSNAGMALEDAKRSLRSTNARVSQLTTENHSLKADNTHLQEQLTLKSRTPSVETERLRNQLSQQNKSLQAENASLKQQLASTSQVSTETNAQRQQLASEISDLKAENASLKLQLADVKASTASASEEQTQLQQLTAQITALKTENASLKQKLQARPVSASTTDSQKQQLTQAIASLKSENASLKEKLAAAPASGGGTISDSELKNLRGQLTVAQQSMNDAIKTINEQNKEIAYLRNQVSDVKTGMDVSGREQISRLQNENTEQDATIRDLQRQLAGKSPVSGGSAAEIASLKRQLETLNVQLQSKNQALESAKGQTGNLEALQQQVTALQDALQEANRKTQAAEAQANGLKNASASQADVQKRDHQIAALQDEITQLRNTLSSGDSTKRELATSKAELEKAQADLAKSHRELEKYRQESASQKQTQTQSNTALQASVARLTDENRQLQKTIADLKQNGAQIADETAEKSQLSNKLAALQADMTDLQKKYEQSLKETKTARQELEAARKSTGVKTASQPATASTAALQTQVDELNQKLSDAEKARQDLETRTSSASLQTASGSNSQAEAAYNQAKSAQAANDLAAALAQFRQAQSLDPNNSHYVLDYSAALAENHQFPEGINLLRAYLMHNAGDRDAYNQLGKLYLLNDQPDAANQAFSRAISVNMLNNYATSLKRLDRVDDAESIFKLALKLNPKDSEVLFNLGNLYNASNKLELARDNYLQALQIRPDFAEAHYNLGLVYSKLGDRQQAITHLEKFLQLSPNARNADTIRAYVEKLRA